ncbi:CRIB domain-containing protein RIC1 [Impatiens glandulifera]|uniref:CRIB domain-containing protein RIC1 n=1 Tax=Impatiens glandulifera TaxID=253017 RepID=UPI001FB085FE|nr:CRIB domain-containing protein RIC1 [Impatiens glandulifera]
MKGLLKGLRYISQIFVEEKEEEIQIGLPTDVKHVAHIGSDGPSSTQPTWMNEFSSAPSNDAPSPVQGINAHEETSESPTRRNSSTKKHSRRRPSSEGVSADSPARDPNAKPRRHKNSNGESPARESSNQKNETTSSRVPKHRKKSKEGPDKLPRPKDNAAITLDAVEERDERGL